MSFYRTIDPLVLFSDNHVTLIRIIELCASCPIQGIVSYYDVIFSLIRRTGEAWDRTHDLHFSDRVAHPKAPEDRFRISVCNAFTLAKNMGTWLLWLVFVTHNCE